MEDMNLVILSKATRSLTVRGAVERSRRCPSPQNRSHLSPNLLCVSLWTLRALCVLPLLFAVPTILPAQSYSRPIALPTTPHPPPYTCLILDSTVYAHAAPTLADLRILNPQAHEIPYAITLSGPSSPESTPATILNQTLRTPTHLTLDLQTPPRPYSALDLIVNTQNFLATAKLTGLRTLTDSHPIYLGTFTLYDLTLQHLGQKTHLEFAESTFPYLHLDLQLTPIAANLQALAVTSAIIPPTRQSQTLYTPLLTAQTFTQTPTETVATFQLPAHVPVERITFTLAPSETQNFSRNVTITAQSTASNTPPETLTGIISHVQTTLLGHKIASDSLAIPAILGSNARDAATVTVTIQNDTAPPLQLRAITLHMRQRKLCFPTVPKAELLYGYRKFTPVAYPFATTFNPVTPTQTATLAPETITLLQDAILPPKPSFTNPPLLVTLALLATLLAASALAIRLFKRR